MKALLEVGRSGVGVVLLHPLRSAATVFCVVAALVPYLVGEGISRGVIDQAEDAVTEGGDLYVSGRRVGRTAPLPEEAVDRIRGIDGVVEAVPRIIGGMRLGVDDAEAVVVGVPLSDADLPSLIEGRLPRADRFEVVLGVELARELELVVGSHIPPFYRSRDGERVFEVVGLFAEEGPIWSTRTVLTSLDNAAHVFDAPGLVTDVVVSCRPGYAPSVSRRIVRELRWEEAEGTLRVRVLAREDLAAVLPRGLLHREGVFQLHLVVAFVASALGILVVSGVGLGERSRETGLLKACGWQTDQLLVRATVESLVLALVGLGLSVVVATLWLELFNGVGIAPIFLTGLDRAPAVDVPYRLLPTAVALGGGLAVSVVLTGALWSTWRTASVWPAEAMR